MLKRNQRNRCIFHLIINGKNIVVCKKCFPEIFKITDGRMTVPLSKITFEKSQVGSNVGKKYHLIKFRRRKWLIVGSIFQHYLLTHHTILIGSTWLYIKTFECSKLCTKTMLKNKESSRFQVTFVVRRSTRSIICISMRLLWEPMQNVFFSLISLTIVRIKMKKGTLTRAMNYIYAGLEKFVT